ncbi:MAG TPA: M56 family metallopeptidase [Planctomycetes bacterium]|nr:M56 family metallopeptidase [Planctomycetota bacterium]
MNGIFDSAYWCTLQVTLVTLFGLAWSALAARHSSARACSILCVTVVAATSLTLVSPLPIHSWITVTVDYFDASSDKLTSADTQRSLDGELPQSAGQSQSDSDQAGISLSQVLSAARFLASNAERPRRENPTSFTIASWCCTVLAAFGFVRLVFSLVFVARTQRLGIRVRDSQLIELVQQMASQLSCQTVPSIRESHRLTSAAVAGFWRPVLVLPDNWRAWTADEQKAVVAHELAHIVRHDSTWRCVASGILAMHFFNPLVHWLLYRVMLYQELAADGMAADVIGRRSYLRSLSALAIQRDHEISRQGCPHVMPVFTGQLIRRIKMLRSMDGSETSSAQGRNRWLALPIVAVAMVGVSPIAVRGIAQPPNDIVAKEHTKLQQKSTAPNVTAVSRTRIESPPIGADHRLFGREPVLLSEIGPNDSGMVVLRIRELMERPAVRAFEPLIIGGITAWFQSVFPHADDPVIDLSAIEWVAGKAFVSVDYDADAPEGSKHNLQFGTSGSGMTAKLSREVDIAAWLKQNVPDTVRHEIKGHEVFQLPVTPSFAPFSIWLTERDGGIISIALEGPKHEVTDSTTVDTIFGNKNEWIQEPVPGWGRSWGNVAGGLIGIAFTDRQVTNIVDVRDHGTELANAMAHFSSALTQRCSTYACAIDTDNSGSGFVIQTRLTHVAESGARQSADEARKIIELAQDAESTKNSGPADQEIIAAAFLNTSLVIEEHADGSADLVATTPMAISDLIALAVTSFQDD